MSIEEFAKFNNNIRCIEIKVNVVEVICDSGLITT